MPRYARLNVPGGVFHVISRCLNREFLIDGPEDRARYLSLIGRAVERSDAAVLAYCLMSNHVHLVVRTGDDPLEKLMKPIHTGYAVWKNARAGRLGPVFASRFKSPLVAADEYLLELVRYVHNNPVRAGMAPEAAAFGGSSHRAYVGLEAAPPWLTLGDVLGRLDADPERARVAFAEWVAEGAGEGRRPELSGEGQAKAGREVATEVGDAWRLSQPIVGSAEFAEKVFADLHRREGPALGHAELLRKRPEFEEVVAHACAVLGLEPWEFEQQPKRRRPQTARAVATWIWVKAVGGTQAEVARALRVNSVIVSNWYGKAVRTLPVLQPVIDEVLRALPVEPPVAPWRTASRVHYRLVAAEEPEVLS